MSADEHDPPFDHGSQPVAEHPTAPPGPGNTASRTVIYVIAGLAVLAALAWVLVPLL